jgi:hypothetical protein
MLSQVPYGTRFPHEGAWEGGAPPLLHLREIRNHSLDGQTMTLYNELPVG